ncbi:TonB-dependent siderophore receptor [Inquilinus sp. Marseille-Q2685]|uniref:TonB-dependent receptor plug domain-containing protein n=1 Tax=Inquilinus sp. Marseille-Q2685 TaxID=2866581 RepID=UPI001CE40E5F|nr:TonB-dependent receptor [Inquilinus sp. Marseille-Q2685]
MPVPSRCILVLLATGAVVPAEAQDTPSALTLEPIVVTANRMPTPSAEVGSAVTMITRQELEDRQIRQLSDALRQVPGVAVSRTGPAGQTTQIRIRGSESNQTLVLIDGVEVNDPSSESEFDFAHLMADDIERIEVLRGPQSALYGSDAIGGVVNIVTRRGEGPAAGTASVEGGGYGTLRGHASVSGGNDDIDYLIGTAGLRTDGASAARRGSEADGTRNGTVYAKIGLHPGELVDIDVVGRTTRFNTDLDGFLGGVGAIDSKDDVDGSTFLGRIQGRLKLLDGRWEHIVGLSYLDDSRDYHDSDDAITASYRGKTTRVDYQTNLTLDSEALLPAEHRLTFAVDHEEQQADSDSGFADFSRRIGTTGLVGQYQLGLFDSLFLTGSVRRDLNDLFRDTTTWRLTAAYKVDATGTKLRASYGTGVKNPTLFELYGFTNTYRGNPDLKPEHAEGWDAGFDQEIWGDRVVLDATYFEQRIGDLIVGSGQGSANLPGTATARGVELGLSVTPVDDLTIRAAYTYTDAEDATGAELVRRPRNIASLDVSYRFLDGAATVNLGVDYNGPQKDLAFDEAYNSSPVTLDGYTLVNLAASYQVTDRVQVYGRIDNLLDEDYEEVWSYGSLRRAGYLGMKVSF